ncbi:excinuclease ABC subunit UvrB [Oligosphaera ethanolica]|uniref:UvrABC system protein B n=1 Tax=Oligosphaera ethanolica TaxID=760260 RepID=A0AAE3VGX8_9BACT|nr:excinuclease ABC subunit UvrB [Oligosphaera ethanolica]MDQ0290282.1 excinuclease ABC subunit B [Oligosphaera ethanolica]
MPDKPFIVHSEYQPAGDQPQAIDALARGIERGDRYQTLLGVTGSGKTFTLANMIAKVQRPTLVVSHNKTLAAQLYSELKSFFPENAVEYFVSYYDYYQPEAYIPQTDTYIAKDSAINDGLERLRLAATGALLERRDVIVVASVSCLYGLGSPEDFSDMRAKVLVSQDLSRDELLRKLVEIQYTRNDIAPERGQFRAAGDTLEIYPSHREDFLRVEFWGDTVERVTRHDPTTRKMTEDLQEAIIFPAKHFVLPQERVKAAEASILQELDEQVAKFERENHLVEAQRIHQRTTYDMEMLKEIGYCSGIENYSRHLTGRAPGSRPYTLVDYFPDDFVTIIDESHATLPQVQAMARADRNRKQTLVDNGFRLPSALDNRPLTFEEFSDLQHNIVFVSATPSDYEMSLTTPVEQVVRPTGLLDPEVEVRPLADQVDDVIEEIRLRAARNERVLVTTLTKRMAEDLSDYLRKLDVRSRYLHSDLDAIERVDILRSLRAGEFDCLVGINLLREGLDLPEVSLVAVLDADKEGFLRSERSLIQTAGRAARNEGGKVILYADKITDSMQRMITLTQDRREKQKAYNAENGITPTTIRRNIQTSLRIYEEAERTVADTIGEEESVYDVLETIRQLEQEMQEAAATLEFERAAMLRDQIIKLKKK